MKKENKIEKVIIKEVEKVPFSKIRFIIFLVFLGICLLIILFANQFGLTKEYVASLLPGNTWTTAFIYLALFVVLTSFGFSVTIMTLAAVLFFPVNLAIVYSMLGLLTSSIVHYYLALFLGKPFVTEYTGIKKGNLAELNNLVKDTSFKTVFLLSAVYFVPPVIPNSLGGLVKMDIWNFVWANIFGNLPNTIATVYLAHGIIFLNYAQIVWGIIALVLISLIAILIYRKHIKDLVKLSFNL